jgi:hypothetical protein
MKQIFLKAVNIHDTFCEIYQGVANTLETFVRLTFQGTTCEQYGKQEGPLKMSPKGQ